MTARQVARKWVFAGTLTLTMALAASGAQAQAAKQAGFEPQSGQAGKDVVWVPTPDELVQKMQSFPNQV